VQFLHETRVLPHTGDPKCLRLSTNCINQIIVWDRRRADTTLDRRVVHKSDGFIIGLYLELINHMIDLEWTVMQLTSTD
jgi:hypothetical protein